MAFESSHPPDICQVPFYICFYSTFSYVLLWAFGCFNDFIAHLLNKNTPPKGYAPLLDGYNSFYTAHIYGRISDGFGRPIVSNPSAWLDLVEREGIPYDNSLRETGNIQHCLNLGSYNYLGFSDNTSSCIDNDIEAIKKYSSSNCSFRINYGTSTLHRELEKKVAGYLGKEDAITFGMGYATNSTTIPALIGKGGLILSDSLNHASLVIGCRSSGATVRVFEHNNIKDLERKLKIAVKSGQPDGKPWQKILIIIEGLYSMEGDIAMLPEIIQLKKKYKAYLYVDEAHSIGAIGKSGRGVCEYWGVNTSDVDVLMGTFTKSFASCGGYIAASHDIINTIRSSSFSSYYDTPMSPICAQQTITVLSVLMGEDGTTIGADRIVNLRKNSIYFRTKLIEKGFIVSGNFDSPVIPLIIYSPVTICAFSRLCLERNLAVVVVGYPATELMMSRARFCMSASHKVEDLDFALREIESVGEACLLQFKGVKA